MNKFPEEKTSNLFQLSPCYLTFLTSVACLKDQYHQRLAVNIRPDILYANKRLTLTFANTYLHTLIIRESSSRYILKKNDLKGAKLFWETMKNNRK